jgi:hypothetical protein
MMSVGTPADAKRVRTPVCGNGILEIGESCDDAGDTALCDADCTPATCGDAYTNVAFGESCDEGGETASCDVDCTVPSCGDARINVAAGEECDGNTPESAACENCRLVCF